MSPATIASLAPAASLFQVSLEHLDKLSCPHIKRRFAKNPSPGEQCVFEGTVEKQYFSFLGLAAAFLLKPLGITLPYRPKAKSMLSLQCVVSVSSHETRELVCKKRKYIYRDKKQNIVKEIFLNSEISKDKDGVLWESMGRFITIKMLCATSAQEIVFKSDNYYVALPLFPLPVGKTHHFALPRFLHLGELVVRHSSHSEISSNDFNLSISLSHPLWGKLFEQTSVFKEV